MSPECLLTFLFCESLDVKSNEFIVIYNIGEYSVSSFHNGRFKFEKPYSKPFDNVTLSTVVLYAPVFNMMLKDKHINFEETFVYLQADLAKLQPIMQPRVNNTFIFNCCGCEKSARDYSQLHFVEQWLMASIYNRKMIYFTNGNKKLQNAEKLYDIVKDLPVLDFYIILSEMSGVTKKLSFTERYFWSTQVPVFKYITKHMMTFLKLVINRGLSKRCSILLKGV